MTVNYTTLLALGQPVTGTESGTWGDDVNNAVTSYLDIAIAGTLTLTGDGSVTLANTQGTNTATNIGATTAQYAAIKVVGPLTATKVITAPSSSKTYLVINTDSTYGVTIKASGQSGITIAAGTRALVAFNGTDYVLAASSTVAALGGLGTGVATALAVNTGTAGAFVVNGGALGTPSSGTLTSCTGLPVSTGVSGFGTGVATALAVNTGTAGAFVVNGGALGTPSSGTLTSCTGLPLNTGVTGTLGVSNGGTGQTTYTDGQLLIGNTSGNTLTKATLTAGSGVTITNGNGSITIATSGGSGDVTGPASATDNGIVRFDGTTGKIIQNASNAVIDDSGNLGLGTTSPGEKLDVIGKLKAQAASTQDAVIVAGRAGGSSSYATTITPTTLTASRTVTIPDETFTIGFRNIPAVGTKTGSYSLGTGDVGKYVQLGTGGAITIPDATFAEGDVITLFNNTTGNITITCSITTAYIAGTDSDKATMTLPTRGVATILFISSTVCVVSGTVT